MSQRPLNDAMDPRALTARWVIRGTLTLETAMHLGGEGTERVDMSVLRDLQEGKPLLPGTTFAGALRDALADRLAGYGQNEPAEVAVLFGAARGDDEGSQSPLIVFDAFGEFPEQSGIEIRDGVAISPATGVAEDHKKFDFEVLPAGTVFPVRVDLLLPAPSIFNFESQPEEKALLERLTEALDAFTHGENALGARRSRGLGRVRALWAARRFDFSSKDGWLAWILSDHKNPFTANPDQASIRNAIEVAAPDELKPLAFLGDARSRVIVELDLRIAHDILIRSPGIDPGAADVSHIRSGGVPILPGTSLAGVIRTQSLRIARLVRTQQSDAENWIDRLFGPRFEGPRPPTGHKPYASRLRVGEARIEGSQCHRQTRVAIDRFTQGAVDTALFDEQTEVGGRAVVRLELRDPREGELGLVLLVVKDLLDGVVPVGGTSSVGRGVLRGSAFITWPERNGSPQEPARYAKVEPRKAPTGEASAEIDKAIRAFHAASPIRKEESGENQSSNGSKGA